MIRHLRWLTRPATAVAPDAIALSVYAEPGPDGALRTRPARETGFEGVACVDDAARAAVLHCLIWRKHRVGWAAREARRYLAFVCGMQDGEGRFVNFIRDWTGARNVSGPTSYPAGSWWTVRALHGLAVGYSTFGDPAYATAFRRGLPWLAPESVSSGAAALGMLAVVSFRRASGDPQAGRAVHDLLDRVSCARQGGVLVDDGDRDPMHLWGRYQEQALLRVAATTGQGGLVSLARASAEALLVPAAQSLPTRAPALPYEASRLARSLAVLATVTDEAHHGELARRSQDWFRGLNAAGVPIYDETAGRAYDGVDRGDGVAVRSRNAGAEANVEAAFALFDRLPVHQFGQPRPARRHDESGGPGPGS